MYLLALFLSLLNLSIVCLTNTFEVISMKDLKLRATDKKCLGESDDSPYLPTYASQIPGRISRGFERIKIIVISV